MSATLTAETQAIELHYELDSADPSRPCGVIVTVNRDTFVQLAQYEDDGSSSPVIAHSVRAGESYRFDVPRLTHKRPNHQWGVWIRVFDHVDSAHPVKRSEFICLER